MKGRVRRQRKGLRGVFYFPYTTTTGNTGDCFICQWVACSLSPSLSAAPHRHSCRHPSSCVLIFHFHPYSEDFPPVSHHVASIRPVFFTFILLSPSQPQSIFFLPFFIRPLSTPFLLSPSFLFSPYHFPNNVFLLPLSQTCSLLLILKRLFLPTLIIFLSLKINKPFILFLSHNSRYVGLSILFLSVCTTHSILFCIHHAVVFMLFLM